MIVGLVVVILLLILLGVPVIGAMGASAAYSLFQQNLSQELLAQQMGNGLGTYGLLAIPLFILAGEIFHRCGGAGALVRFVNSFVGWVPGGLGVSAIVSTMIFSGLSGSVNADAAAIGAVMVPSMVKAKYSRPWAASIVAAAAGTGILIPPSITMIVLATIANLSPRTLFLASLGPAVVVAVSKIIVVYSKARFFETDQEWSQTTRFSGSEVGRSALAAIPALIAPFIILGGILTGVFTATEAAAIAVVYTVILALGYRTLRWSETKSILFVVGRLSGIVLGLVAVAQVLSYIFAYNGVDQQLNDFMGGFIHNYLVFISLVIVIFWVVGALLDGLPALIILLPFFINPPTGGQGLAEQAGINDYHFAILSLATLGISL